MKSPNVLLALTATALLTACSGHKASGEYDITIPTGDPSLNGTVAYLVDYDSGEKTDSAVVTADTIRFSGSVTTPYMARIIVDGARKGIVIVESGSAMPDSTGLFRGTELNDRFATALSEMDALSVKANAAPRDSAGAATLDSLNALYDSLTDKAIDSNSDNPVGYYFFLQRAYRMDLPELDSALKAIPAMGNYTRIINLRSDLEKKAATSPGAKYKDFTVSNDSVSVKLSDFVGKDGKFTLVDFWASWCGPCRREIPVIKSLYEKYRDTDLNVVGVAVWDEPQATLAAIKELDIPWPCIIDAQRIPTDIYGISGIPCIILIDPQGTIVSRDRQGDELVKEVAKCIADYREEQARAEIQAQIPAKLLAAPETTDSREPR